MQLGERRREKDILRRLIEGSAQSQGSQGQRPMYIAQRLIKE
jgi:hypothetical protein